jgi:large subunit ribosomal protein L14
MIQKESVLTVADNSGVKKTQCIHIYNKKKVGQIGDKILLTIKQGRSKNGLCKGDLVSAIIVRVRSHHRTQTNNYLVFADNSVVLVNKQGQPLGTRLFGPIPITFRNDKKFKIMSLGAILI